MTDRDAFLRKIAASPGDDVARLVYADWCEEHGADRELATAEFVRLTCGLPEPKRPKTKRCSECNAPGESQLEIVERVRRQGKARCVECNGTGRMANPPGHRLYPKAAHEWLLANWRRLVPVLTKDWEADAVLKHRGWPGTDDSRAAFTTSPTWKRRGYLRVFVPMLLPTRPLGNPTEWFQVYTPFVELSFHRGFVTDASWRAPVLGEKIAAMLAEDQPLAEQSGPHALGKFGEVTMGTIVSATFAELGNMRYEQVRRDLEAQANIRSLLRGRPNPTPEEAP